MAKMLLGCFETDGIGVFEQATATAPISLVGQVIKLPNVQYGRCNTPKS
jgi:hypothetical protein